MSPTLPEATLRERLRSGFRVLAPRGPVKRFLGRHGRKLWWLHTLYALGLGVFVASFAQKGLDHAPWLAASIVGAWLVVLVFFRVFGSGAKQDLQVAWAAGRLRFFAMTYVLKNLYQGMLFFLLPVYFRSATLASRNAWFLGLLAVCALVSTLDLVFDRLLLRFRTPASLFHALTLFASVNLAIPALLPEARALVGLLVAAGLAMVGFLTLHLPVRALARASTWALVGALVVLGVGAAYAGRSGIPPVPLYLARGGVGTELSADGDLAVELSRVRSGVLPRLVGVTDVATPGARGQGLVHVWRRDGETVLRQDEATAHAVGPNGVVRLRSLLEMATLTGPLAGAWRLDVETEDGQLVGSVPFDVEP